jgi:hypothetical protein
MASLENSSSVVHEGHSSFPRRAAHLVFVCRGCTGTREPVYGAKRTRPHTFPMWERQHLNQELAYRSVGGQSKLTRSFPSQKVSLAAENPFHDK